MNWTQIRPAACPRGLLLRDIIKRYKKEQPVIIMVFAMDGVCIIVLMMSSSRSTSRISRSVRVLRTDHNKSKVHSFARDLNMRAVEFMSLWRS
jgi:hypothetical protein